MQRREVLAAGVANTASGYFFQPGRDSMFS
jgi:hypothetical protein